LARQARRTQLVNQRVARARYDFDLPEHARDALVVGCGYWLYEPLLARSVVASVKFLVGPVKLVSECCGEVLKAAGDESGYSVQAERIRHALSGAERVIAYDAGCAMALQEPRLQTVVELASESKRLRVAAERVKQLGPLRYHDPCRLGRGLKQYDAPRRLIERISGSAVAEFRHNRQDAVCAGGGALLPASYPEVARTIAEERVQEHRMLGGGTIVSACAASLRQFRRVGADVVDVAWLLSQGTTAG
jgi:Fe-S oxidoreductase